MNGDGNQDGANNYNECKWVCKKQVKHDRILTLMAYVCDYCERKSQYGGSHTHGKGIAGGRWKKRAPVTRKVFHPNLHAYQGLKLCTKCLRKVKAVPVIVA